MKITDLHVDGFGVWSDLSLCELSGRLTVLFGRNEAGKTTLMQFVRAVLYGFTRGRRSRYVPPVSGSAAGGWIGLTTGNGNVRIGRHLRDGAPPDDLGDLEVTAEDGTAEGQERLSQLLGDVDDAIFGRVFAIGLRDIQELGALNETAAAQYLYHLTTGVDRVSLVEVMRALSASRNRILAPDEEPCEITKLFARHEQLQGAIEQLRAQGAQWSRAAARCEAIEDEIRRLERENRQLEDEARLVEIALQVRDWWLDREELSQQIAELGAMKELDPRAIRRVDRLHGQLQQWRAKLGQIKHQRQALREQAARLPIHRPLWVNAARIEALGEQRPWIASLRQQMDELEAETSQLAADLEDQCRKAGIPVGFVRATPLDLSSQALGLVREPASVLRRAARQVKEARQQCERYRQKWERLDRRLTAELAERGQSSLAAALERAGQQVSQLRRAHQLDQRIDKLVATAGQVEETIDRLLDQPVLPTWQLVALGVPFALGALLILGGIVWPALSAIGWPLAVLGLGGWAAAAGTKYLQEKNTSRQLDRCNRQLDRIRQQLRQAKDERERLGLSLPPGDQLDGRLNSAQQELEQLEQLLPLDAERRAAKKRCEKARLRTGEADKSLAAARNQWQRALRAIGLPADLLPVGVPDVASCLERISELQRRLAARRDELDRRQHQWRSICGRIEQLSSEVGFEADGSDPQSQLNRLLDAAAEQRKLIERRQALKQRHRAWGRRGRRGRKKARSAARQRRRLLQALGVCSHKELRRRIEREAGVQELQRRREELAQQIAAARGDQYDEAEIARLFRQLGPDALQQRWDELMAQRQRNEAELRQLHERRGQLRQELKSLCEDRRLDAAKRELSWVKQRLKDAVRQWQVLAVVSLLLDSIRETYETERQPETLREASSYLGQLTLGRYTRIWAPLGANTLRVDGADGQSLSLEMLSRGTREAVYLSLRLALAAAYGQHGPRLPLVLDDVLVNFDAERAKAAARTLRDFARNGHQVLLFTCHEHIVKACRAVKAEVRQLPDCFERLASAKGGDPPPAPGVPRLRTRDEAA